MSSPAKQHPGTMKIPVLLITGFLGSGKTTFLRRLASTHPEHRLVFLVNEFAHTSVDGDSLAAAGTPTQSVVGGSLFCNCKAAEFVRIMNESVLPHHQDSPLDAVIIETSGIADPEALGKIMQDFKLDQHFSVENILCVTTPKSLLKLAGRLPNINAQIRTSETVIINKTDLSSADEIARASDCIQSINPRAKILQAHHCEVPLTLDNLIQAPRPAVELPQQELSSLAANPYTTRTISWNSQAPHPSREEIDQWLQQLPPSILRVKGLVRTDQQWLRIEKSHDSSSVNPASPPTGDTSPGVVLIAEHEQVFSLEQQCSRLSALNRGSA